MKPACPDQCPAQNYQKYDEASFKEPQLTEQVSMMEKQAATITGVQVVGDSQGPWLPVDACGAVVVSGTFESNASLALAPNRERITVVLGDFQQFSKHRTR